LNRTAASPLCGFDMIPTVTNPNLYVFQHHSGGFALYYELQASESAEVRAHPTGSITVFTGSHSHGQGHETSFAQLVVDRFGLPLEMVDIVHGDTGKVPFGMGTYASRSLAVGGTALVKAMDKIVAKGKKIAAHLLDQLFCLAWSGGNIVIRNMAGLSSSPNGPGTL
jgi:CO/xanthine dehydrogenase Mo-binding subunit